MNRETGEQEIQNVIFYNYLWRGFRNIEDYVVKISLLKYARIYTDSVYNICMCVGVKENCISLIKCV